MKKLSKKNIVKNILTFLVSIAVLGGALLVQSLLLNEQAPLNTDLRSYSTLSYCSDITDKTCEPNISVLDVQFLTPYSREKGINFVQMDVFINIIEIEYYKDLEKEFKGDFILFQDANNNGAFDDVDGGDTRLSKSSTKKKILIFEDIDFTAPLKWAKNGSLDTTYKFFIVSEDNTDRFYHKKLNKLKVHSYDTRIATTPENQLYSRTSAIDLSMWKYDQYINMSRSEFLKHSQLFIADEKLENGVILKKGQYILEETEIIPAELSVFIEAGVEVKVEEGVSLVSYSPIDIKGTETLPVRFVRATDQPWGVFAVIGNQGEFGDVLIDYAYFEGGSETEINGAYLSGMVSLYRAGKTTVKNTVFENAFADDSLNIKYSEVDLSFSEFNNNSADAFDGDFVTGKVYRNEFVKNGNDSIDTSGSSLKIVDNYIYKSGDKCMSFGEGSDNRAINNLLYKCAIGIEVKDGSNPYIANNLFLENGVGYNSYLKKYFYESPSTELVNNLFIGNKEQVTFNNSFTGDILKSDNSTINMKNNLFDKKYEFDAGRDLCISCSNNVVQQVTITDGFLFNKKIGLIRSYWTR